MKTPSSAVAILFSISFLFAVVSCTRTNQPPSLSAQILGKWTVKNACDSSANYGVSWKDTAWFTVNDYFDFKADSTLSIFIGGQAYNGKWQITTSRLYITQTNYMDNTSGYGLPVLTNTDLQLWDTASSLNTYLDQRLNLYR